MDGGINILAANERFVIGGSVPALRHVDRGATGELRVELVERLFECSLALGLCRRARSAAACWALTFCGWRMVDFRLTLIFGLTGFGLGLGFTTSTGLGLGFAGLGGVGSGVAWAWAESASAGWAWVGWESGVRPEPGEP